MRIGCVILAAGLASRFGRNKLLEPWQGKALVQWALDALAAARLAPVCVVTAYAEVEALAAAYGCRVVRNEAPALGIGRSVMLGTRALLPERCDGILFLVADQPRLRAQTVAALADCFRAEPTRIVVPTAGARQGNPCIFPAALFPELLALRGDRGGKLVVRAHPELVKAVPVPPEELDDIDQPADLHPSGPPM